LPTVRPGSSGSFTSARSAIITAAALSSSKRKLGIFAAALNASGRASLA
jgi:hypothetical protein